MLIPSGSRVVCGPVEVMPARLIDDAVTTTSCVAGSFGVDVVVPPLVASPVSVTDRSTGTSKGCWLTVSMSVTVLLPCALFTWSV